VRGVGYCQYVRDDVVIVVIIPIDAA